MGRPPSGSSSKTKGSLSNSPADGLLLLEINAGTAGSATAAAAAMSAAAASSGRTSANRNAADVDSSYNNNNNNDDAAAAHQESNNSGGDNNMNVLGNTKNGSSNNNNNNTNIDSTSSSWKPPLWLQADGGGGGGGATMSHGSSGGSGKSSNATTAMIITNNNSRKIKTFKMPIPPVPNAVRNAIGQRILTPHVFGNNNTTNNTNNPLEPERARIRALSTKLRDQQLRARKIQDKIALSQQKKEATLQEIRARHEASCRHAVDQMRREKLQQHDEQVQQRAAQWKQKVQEECSARWKIRQDERLAKRAATTEQQANNAKRKQEQESRSAAESSPPSLLEEPPSKKARLEAGGSGDNNDGIGATLDDDKKIAPATAAATTATADAEVKASGVIPCLESEVKQQQIDELQKEADSLNQNRTELIWLLKQVIKSEEKQKAKLSSSANTKPPEARIASSKQA